MSVVVLMRGRSGTDEYDAVEGNNHSILTTTTLDYTHGYTQTNYILCLTTTGT